MIYVISILALLIAVANISYLHKSFRQGLRLWSKILPSAATFAFLGILFVNLAPFSNKGWLDLCRIFSRGEMFILLLCGLGFFTKYGNIIAGATLLYASQYILKPSCGSYTVIMASSLSVLVLGDRQPWFPRPNVNAYKLREVAVFFIGISAIAVFAVAIIKMNSLQRWVFEYYGHKIQAQHIAGVLTLGVAGWFSVAAGLTRPIVLLSLALPSIIVLSFLTTLPLVALWLTLLMILSLSLGPCRQVV